MKLKIEKAFVDKNTGKRYEVGKAIEFAEDRAKELLSDARDLVSKVAEEAEEKKLEEKKPAAKKPTTKAKK